MPRTLHEELAQKVERFNTLRELLEDNIEARAEAIERGRNILLQVRKFKDAAHKAANADKFKGIKSDLLTDAMMKLVRFEAEITDQLISANKRQKSDKVELKRVVKFLADAEADVDAALSLSKSPSAPTPTANKHHNPHKSVAIANAIKGGVK